MNIQMDGGNVALYKRYSYNPKRGGGHTHTQA